MVLTVVDSLIELKTSTQYASVRTFNGPSGLVSSESKKVSELSLEGLELW